jgi:NAD(P)-dependent dehydrogenase (short-subunit alcohol dehydrogenase family)
VNHTVARFDRLDIAVNSTGTERKPGPVVDQSFGSCSATLDTNVLGILLSIKHELRVMQKQGAAASSTSLPPLATRQCRVSWAQSTPACDRFAGGETGKAYRALIVPVQRIGATTCSNYLDVKDHASNDIASSHSAVSYPRT